MAAIKTLEELRSHYGAPSKRALLKELDHVDKHCRRFIELSPFMLIGTVGADGRADVSPRGEAPGFVHVLDEKRLALPDRPGNNRLDSLTNIVTNPAVGLCFLVPGVHEALRINGQAEIRDDEDLKAMFAIKGRLPATVLVITVQEAYLQCAKSVMRSRLWDPDARIDRSELPTMGEMLRDQIGGDMEAEPQDKMLERYKDILY